LRVEVDGRPVGVTVPFPDAVRTDRSLLTANRRVPVKALLPSQT
jgi:hypothetical protein